MTGSDVISLGDSISRAVLSALAATDTFFLVDNEGNELLTYACGTLLVNDVSNILISEVLESRKNRVRSCLTETAK